jgi:serine/threonine protein kinase
MANLVGQTLLDQFRVEAFVASGGMGAVYRAWDVKRNVSLAMKVLHAELADDPSIFKRFEREARALRKLAHPNIVPFYGLYKTDDFAFLLEQFVDGLTLKQVLKRQNGRPLPIDQVLIYLKALSAALGYAHANGVVHCDVKPGNVMIDHGGSIFLTDFGIARHAESTTTTLGFAGTAAYMAPEQCLEQPVTPATDVYALGVMLYEMVTGARPFRGEESGTDSSGSTAAERMRHAHLHVAPSDPRQLNSALPAALSQVILTALAKEPQVRYRGTRELYEAACAAVQIDPYAVPDRAALPQDLYTPIQTPIPLHAAAPSMKSQPYAPSTPPKPVGRPTAILIVGIVAVLLLIGGAFVVIRPSSTPTSPTEPTVAAVSQVPSNTQSALTIAASTAAEATDTQHTPEPTELPPPTGTPLPTYTPLPANTPQPGGTIVHVVQAGDTLFGLSIQYNVPLEQIHALNNLNSQSILSIGQRIIIQAGTGTQSAASATPRPPTTPTKKPPTFAPPPPACPAVSGPFAGIWAAVQDKIGCAADGAATTFAAQEKFQGGWMYWREDNDRIYAIYRSGNWGRYNDIWQEGDPDFSCLDANTPAGSPPTPARGFGKIWCAHPEVRSGLGNATDGEQGFDVTVQKFDQGIMLRTDLGIWILYNNGLWERR